MAVQWLQRYEAACGAWKEENVMSCRQVNRALEHPLSILQSTVFAATSFGSKLDRSIIYVTL